MPLVVEEEVVHLPVAALRRRGLCRFGSSLGVRVYPGEREGPKGEKQPVSEVMPEPPDAGPSHPRVGTLEVSVLDQRHLGGRQPQNVVPLADRDGKPDSLGARLHASTSSRKKTAKPTLQKPGICIKKPVTKRGRPSPEQRPRAYPR